MLKLKKNPDRVKKERKPLVPTYTDKRKTIIDTGKKDKDGKPVQYKVDRKLTLQERKDRVAKKIAKSLKQKKWEDCGYDDDHNCN